MAIKHCEVCGKEFVDYGRGKYCKGPHYKQCVICGKEFEYDVRSQYQSKTCSNHCSSILTRKNSEYKLKQCPVCNMKFKPHSGNQIFCSAECRMKNDII